MMDALKMILLILTLFFVCQKVETFRCGNDVCTCSYNLKEMRCESKNLIALPLLIPGYSKKIEDIFLRANRIRTISNLDHYPNLKHIDVTGQLHGDCVRFVRTYEKVSVAGACANGEEEEKSSFPNLIPIPIPANPIERVRDIVNDYMGEVNPADGDDQQPHQPQPPRPDADADEGLIRPPLRSPPRHRRDTTTSSMSSTTATPFSSSTTQTTSVTTLTLYSPRRRMHRGTTTTTTTQLPPRNNHTSRPRRRGQRGTTHAVSVIATPATRQIVPSAGGGRNRRTAKPRNQCPLCTTPRMTKALAKDNGRNVDTRITPTSYYIFTQFTSRNRIQKIAITPESAPKVSCGLFQSSLKANELFYIVIAMAGLCLIFSTCIMLTVLSCKSRRRPVRRRALQFSDVTSTSSGEIVIFDKYGHELNNDDYEKYENIDLKGAIGGDYEGAAVGEGCRSKVRSRTPTKPDKYF